MNNITWKGAIGLSVPLAVLMMALFGNSVDNPTGILVVGPVSACFGLIALAAALFYPRSPSD